MKRKRPEDDQLPGGLNGQQSLDSAPTDLDAANGGENSVASAEATCTKFAALVEALSPSRDSISQATSVALDAGQLGLAPRIVRMILDAMNAKIDSKPRLAYLYLLDSILRTESRNTTDTSLAVFPRAVSAAVCPVVQALYGDEDIKPKVQKVLAIWKGKALIDSTLIDTALVILEQPPPEIVERKAAPALEAPVVEESCSGLKKIDASPAPAWLQELEGKYNAWDYRLRCVYLMESGENVVFESKDWYSTTGSLADIFLLKNTSLPEASNNNINISRPTTTNSSLPSATVQAHATRPLEGLVTDSPLSWSGQDPGKNTSQPCAPPLPKTELTVPQTVVEFDDFDHGLLGAVGGYVAPAAAAPLGVSSSSGTIAVRTTQGVNAGTAGPDLLSQIDAMQNDDGNDDMGVGGQIGASYTVPVLNSFPSFEGGNIAPPMMPPVVTTMADEDDQAGYDYGPPPLPRHSPIKDEYSLWMEGFGAADNPNDGYQQQQQYMGQQQQDWYSSGGAYQYQVAVGGAPPPSMPHYMMQQQPYGGPVPGMMPPHMVPPPPPPMMHPDAVYLQQQQQQPPRPMYSGHGQHQWQLPPPRPPM